MGENSKIAWCDHTFNCWRGCVKVSPGCAHCYAETMAGRNPKTLGTWGSEAAGGKRVVAAEGYWEEPLKWAKEAKQSADALKIHKELCRQAGISDWRAEWTKRDNGNPPPTRPRVFCASMADVFEEWEGPMTCHKTGEPLSINEKGHIWPFAYPSMSDGDDWGSRDYSMDDVRARLFRLITSTPELDWLLLTKRPENVMRMIRRAIDPLYGPTGNEEAEPNGLDVAELHELYPNVWIGTTVENQKYADERIPHLLEIPAAVRFLSVEPQLEKIELCNASGWKQHHFNKWAGKPILGGKDGIHWVICGGESGSEARPFLIEWARSLRQQCEAAGVAFFMKQMGSNPHMVTSNPAHMSGAALNEGATAELIQINFKHRKGEDPAEWPADLQIQEFPKC